jgi:hypothetical protein
MTPFDRPSTPSSSSEPLLTAVSVDRDRLAWDAFAAPQTAEASDALRSADLKWVPEKSRIAARAYSIAAGKPTLQLLVCGAAFAMRIGRALRALRPIAMWTAIALAGAVVGTFALCSPTRAPHGSDIGPDPDWQPLPDPNAPDAQLLARARQLTPRH